METTTSKEWETTTSKSDALETTTSKSESLETTTSRSDSFKTTTSRSGTFETSKSDFSETTSTERPNWRNEDDPNQNSTAKTNSTDHSPLDAAFFLLEAASETFSSLETMVDSDSDQKSAVKFKQDEFESFLDHYPLTLHKLIEVPLVQGFGWVNSTIPEIKQVA